MAEEATPETPTPFDAKALDDAALTAEYDRIRARGQELAVKADATPEEIAELAELASRVDAVNAEINDRTDALNAQNEQREKFGTLPEVTLPSVVIPTAVAKAGEPAPEPSGAAQTPVVPSVSELGAQTPVQPVATGRSPQRSQITAFVSADAAGFAGKSVGEAFSGITEISEALIKSTAQYGRVGGGRGARHAIAQFHRDRGEELTISDPGDKAEAKRVLDYARSEARLHGGSLAKQWQHNIDQGASLTAAAGWCAPSENDYDLCRQWSAGVGLLDLPTVTVRRGGLNYTSEPTFQTIYANAVAAGGGSNFLTEAQVIADTVKTCSEIPCPTFTNRRLDVLALCIRVSLLQAAGFPELVNLWQDGLLASNEAEMNRLILADMITTAGAATTVVGPDPDLGDSFTAGLLQAVGLAAEDIRYARMMSWTDTIEVVLPHWVIPQMRTDLSRRSGDTGNLLSVTDQYIASLFSAMNVRVQFVRGWQDGLITGGALNPAFPGGDIATPFMTALPTTVSFLAYPAGSVAVARQDVVTLTNVYDAASLSVNEFTALFAEEGFAPVYPCGAPRLYTTPVLCVAGTTGSHSIDCVDAA